MTMYFRLMAAGPLFFVSAWLLMLFAGATATETGVRPFGYLTAMVATIGLWLVLAPAVSAVAHNTGGGQRPRDKARQKHQMQKHESAV